ncbi:MAG: sugar-binding protein [Eubacteriales bacterium]
MKKIMTLGLALTLVAAMAVTASAKQSYDAAMGTPVIDGLKDDVYTVATEIVVDHETNMLDSGFATGLCYTAWDSNYLYVFIEVTDPVISTEQGDAVYLSDSVEAYLDLLNEEGNLIAEVEAGQFTAGYLYVDDNFEVTGDNWAGVGTLVDAIKEGGKAHFEITDKGYNCEMMIPWVDFTPAVGTKVGFTIAINDDADDAAGREYQIFPDDDLANAWQETTNYATLTLTDKTYVAPVEEAPADEAPAEDGGAEAPVAPTTADAGIVAAAALMAVAAGVVLSKKH